MALPNSAINDGLLVSFVGTLASQKVISTFFYRVTANPTPSPWDALYNDIHGELIAPGGLRAEYLNCCPNNYTLQQIRLQVIAPTRLSQVFFNQTGQVGAVGFSAAAPNTAAVITRRGDLGNRRNISTLHVPCAQDASIVTGGVLTVGFSATLGALATEMKNQLDPNFGAVTLKPHIYSKSAPGTITPITQTFTQDTARVMRRRTVRVGE